MFKSALKQGEQVRGVGLFATVESLTHVIEGLQDGLEVLGTVESGFFEVVEQALEERMGSEDMFVGKGSLDQLGRIPGQ